MNPLQWRVMNWQDAQNILIAVVILIVAHFVAKAVKWAIAKGVDRIPFLARRDSDKAGGERPAVDVGERLGEVGYWVVWLLGLIAALDQLGRVFPGLAEIGGPLNNMVNGFILYVPVIVAALVIFIIGFALATIARRMVEAAVEAAELDRRLIDAGLTHLPRGPGLARVVGAVVFALIIIPVAIQALDTLEIRAISEPAKETLNSILNAIPGVLGAALIILIAYVVGRWISNIAEQGLRAIGFDDIIASIAQAEPIRTGFERMDPTPGVDTIDFKGFPPSRMIGVAILIGIVLVASVQAATLLEFAPLADMLQRVVLLATQVLFGAVIIGLGVLLANILALVAGRGEGPAAEIMSVLVRWGVIALAAAVGLRFMGLANDIIVLAFGLILGSVAVAVAIAFGIGGRDAAKKLLDRWIG